MKIIGLTGGIGSGKSTVAEMFRELGVPVYDSDVEAKNIMVSSEEVRSAIQELLGEESYQNGQLNRYYIASKIFADPRLLEALNGIVHPAVREHFKAWAQSQESPYVIQESALIFENGMEEYYDSIILVSAPKEVRLSRVVQRDQVGEEEVLARMNNQMSDDKQEDLGHFRIHNLDLESTHQQVRELHEILVKQAD